MKGMGIERTTLLFTLIPILGMAFLLEGAFILTRFHELDRTLLEKSQVLTHQLATSAEYAVFSGNAILLKQNVEAAMSFQDIKSISIFDNNSRLIFNSGGAAARPRLVEVESVSPLFQDENVLRLHEPIMATQINLDGLLPTPVAAIRLGDVMVEVSKLRLNRQKNNYLFFSLLFTLLVCVMVLVLALKNARSITRPILQIHQLIRRIAAGNLEEDMAPRCKILELQELGNGIRIMAQQLQRNREELESRFVETADNLRVKKAEVEQANIEKELLNENLALALSELQAIMEANPDILYVFNTKGELIQCNSNFAKFCGVSKEEMLNRHVLEFVIEQDRHVAAKGVDEVFGKGFATLEAHLLRHDGVAVPYLCNGVVLKNPNGEIIGFTGTGRDITERKMAAEHLYHMAHYDILTDLPNRSLLSDRLQQAIIANRRDHGHLALMFLDLDMFKYVNDNLGHDIGDLLLKEAAKRILDCVRESDTAARIGGDEFVVLLPSVESTQMAMRVAEKIRNALCLPFDIAGHSLNISSSIGVAVYPEHGGDEKHLLKNADSAMYLAKRNGRNTVVLFSA